MLTLARKKALVVILGLFFISLVSYVYYQDKYIQFIDQPNYYATKNTVIQADTTPPISFLNAKGNHSTGYNDSSYKSGAANMAGEQFRTPMTKAGCTPYLKDVYVVPVPEHGKEYTATMQSPVP